jgi:hypothetical protein
MNKLYETWAPEGRIWSQWAKPVLFAHCTPPIVPDPAPYRWPMLEAGLDRGTALLIELPRQRAVEYGIGAARIGYWPVRIFNCADGPGAVLNVKGVLELLARGAQELSGLRIPIDAPPAFLLDSHRMKPEGSLLPGSFDNRYIILPQDFPSAGFLKAHGITRVVWIRQSSTMTKLTNGKAEDLAHVLCRWQEAGLALHASDVDARGTEPIRVTRPSQFRSLFYRAFALLGLRRNSAGGFGGIIPQPSSGG